MNKSVPVRYALLGPTAFALCCASCLFDGETDQIGYPAADRQAPTSEQVETQAPETSGRTLAAPKTTSEQQTPINTDSSRPPCPPAEQTPPPYDGQTLIGATALAGLARGINLGNWLEATPGEQWRGDPITEQHFELIKDAGFDHIRLPVRFSAYASTAPPYAVDHALWQRVDWAIDQALKRQLAVVIDLHHYNELKQQPAQHQARFIAIWTQIATRYASRPDLLKYELFNEPDQALDQGDAWNAIARQAIAAVRAIDHQRAIILDTTPWGRARGLAKLAPLFDHAEIKSDPAVVASAHLYEPDLFTHQGSPWNPKWNATVGVIYPGPPPARLTPVPEALLEGWVKQWFEDYNTLPMAYNPSGPKEIRAQYQLIDDFIAKTGRLVYVGEFGVIDQADAASRACFMRTIRQQAEIRGLPWAYWDDGGSFATYNVANKEWLPWLRPALLE